MKARRLGILFTLLALAHLSWGQNDSIRVVKLLREGAKQPKETCLILYYANQFIGVPYIGKTLEVNKTEKLVVNLFELDCTTLVENCVALTLTTRQGSTAYADFCKNLTRIRYWNGKIDGYASRNHYFTQWIRSNERQGLIKEISSPTSLFSSAQHINLNYMSQHKHLYPMLKNDSCAQMLIRQYEREASDTTIHYIPKAKLNKKKQTPLGSIRDGDILAIVTQKDGLDTSHLGIAKWGKDGKLHLLNASQIHKKVILEPMTLYKYMSKHPTQLGIRVIRVNP